jgi:hypothetical protein
MPKWVRLIFGHHVNAIIILLHKKLQRNPHHHLGFMIKYLEEAATRNEFAEPVCSALCFNENGDEFDTFLSLQMMTITMMT